MAVPDGFVKYRAGDVIPFKVADIHYDGKFFWFRKGFKNEREYDETIAPSANFAGKLEIPNLRRMSVSDLIYRLQDIQLDQFYWPGMDGPNKDIYQARIVTEIRRELERRQNMPAAPINTNVGIIRALKERADIIEVIEQFTEVFTHGGQWTYRCPLHADQHPSGKAYKEENKAHCFQCSKGGDVLDIIGLFGHTDLPGAITWACKFYGIAPTILPAAKKRGGVQI